VEGLHTHRGRRRVSHPQERPAAASIGIRKRTVARHILVCFLATCCGKHWGRSVGELAWGTSRDGCSRNWARSSWWMWCCRRVKEPRFVGGASQSHGHQAILLAQLKMHFPRYR